MFSLDTLIAVFFIFLLLLSLLLGASSYLKAVILLEICVLINFVFLSYQVAYVGDVAGASFLFYVLSVAAAETSVAFALLIVYYKNVGNINFNPISRIK